MKFLMKELEKAKANVKKIELEIRDEEPKCTKSNPCQSHGKYPKPWRIYRHPAPWIKFNNDEIVLTREKACFQIECITVKIDLNFPEKLQTKEGER